MSVGENIAYPLRVRGMARADRESRAGADSWNLLLGRKAGAGRLRRGFDLGTPGNDAVVLRTAYAAQVTGTLA